MTRLVRMDLHTREAAEVAATEILDLPLGVAPTACFASQNLVAIGTLRALRARDRTRDIAMVGFDDIELADLLDPGITVVQSDPYAIGRVAAELLFDRLDGYRGPSRHRMVTTRLVPGAQAKSRLPPDRCVGHVGPERASGCRRCGPGRTLERRQQRRVERRRAGR